MTMLSKRGFFGLTAGAAATIYGTTVSNASFSKSKINFTNSGKKRWEDVYEILLKLSEEDRIKVMLWFTEKNFPLLDTKLYHQFARDHWHVTLGDDETYDYIITWCKKD